MPGRRRRRGLTRVAHWAAHWALFCWLIAAPLHATSLRVGEHDGFSRVVFSVTPGVTQSVTPDGDKLLLHLAGAGAVPGAARGLRNVKSIEGGQDQAVLLLSPGCQPRIWRTGALIVVDIYSPGVSPPGAPISKKIATPQGAAAPVAPREAAHRAETPHAAQPEFTLVPVEQAPLPPPAKSANHADSAPAPATPPAAVPGATPKTVPAPALPPAGADAGESLVAERLPDDAVLGEAAILVPFDSMVAAAAFPRGGLAHVIFDDSKPVDLAALKDDPVFGSARVTLLPAATHLTLRMPDGVALRLQHRKDGWVIAVRAGGRAGPSAELKAQEGALAIGTPQPADTIVMDDKATGGRLLVGTVLGEGPGVAVPHVSAEFSVLPSWAGRAGGRKQRPSVAARRVGRVRAERRERPGAERHTGWQRGFGGRGGRADTAFRFSAVTDAGAADPVARCAARGRRGPSPEPSGAAAANRPGHAGAGAGSGGRWLLARGAAGRPGAGNHTG